MGDRFLLKSRGRGKGLLKRWWVHRVSAWSGEAFFFGAEIPTKIMTSLQFSSYLAMSHHTSLPPLSLCFVSSSLTLLYLLLVALVG